MKDARPLAQKSDALQALMEEKFRFRSRDLAQALKRTGRRLPRRHRRQVQAVIEARKLEAHPKLAVQIEVAPLIRGMEEVTAYLRALDVAGQRRDRLLNLAALIAFYVLVVLVAFVTWLWWRGYI